MTRRAAPLVAAATAAALVLLVTAPVDGYLIFGGPARWKQLPVRYFITNTDVPGVSAQALQTAVASAFEAWTSVGTTRLSSEFVGFTNASPAEEDGATVIGFLERTDLERVLGQTNFQFDLSTNQFIEADIFLNSTFSWSTASGGAAQRFDVASIATHEVGHLFGLGHSALGETELLPAGTRRVLGKRAVMFPIAFPASNIEDRTLEADDIAAISTAYPSPAFVQDTGAISGRVTLSGAGVFGAHVTALSPSTGQMVSAFSLDSQGRFVIAGLEPGLYLLRVEPLDDADIDSFFQESANVTVDFRAAYHPRLVAVPKGGSVGEVQVTVVRK